jgi:glycosyltransferase involved in cell wall biosynthesis
MESDKLPLVSTITPVLNGEKYIAGNLESIKNQTYSNIEMIVVDNFSVDKTPEIAKRMGAIFYQKGPERASQDNYGVEMSHGKYIFITGCDMVLDKDYIEKAVKCCEDGNFDAVYASVKSRTTNYWSKVKGLERDLYIGDDVHEAARFIKREVFLKLGGFDITMVLHADDYDMQRKLNSAGYKTGRIDSYETHIDEIDSIKEVFLKSFYYGMHSWEYMKKYKGSAVKQLSPIRGVFFKNYKKLLSHPLLTAGIIIFKIVQYSSATTGLIFGMFKTKKVSKAFHKSIYNKDRK